MSFYFLFFDLLKSTNIYSFYLTFHFEVSKYGLIVKDFKKYITLLKNYKTQDIS